MRIAWVALVISAMAPVSGWAQTVSEGVQRLERWFPIVHDTQRADSAYTAIGLEIVGVADSATRSFAHYLRFLAARSLDRVGAMRTAADSSFTYHRDPSAPFEFAQYLARRRVQLEVAELQALRAISTFDPSVRSPVLGHQLSWLGHIRLLRGDAAGAAATLENALTHLGGDPPWTLLTLARAAQTTNPDRAISALIQAVASFEDDSSSQATAARDLDSLYAARHGSAAGLAPRLAEARAGSLRRGAFESRRDGREIEDLRLLDMRDSTVKRIPLSQGLTVVDVWGTWCAPCIESFPALHRLAAEFEPRGARFVTLDVEGVEPAIARGRVLRYLERHRFELPVFGADSLTVEHLQVTAFPTTLVVENGRVLFRNEGLGDRALRAQLAALLDGTMPAEFRQPPARGRD